MATSYNGWFASPDLRLRPLVVAGEPFVPGVLDDDDVHTVLQYVAQQMHERVEPIIRSDWHDEDDWGFHFKVSTGDPSKLSCHSSGTAIDYNATRHPYGVSTRANFSQEQIDEIHKILAEVGVVVWGGDWNHPDAMHFEIAGTKAQVAMAADRIRNGDEDEMKAEDWARLREIVREEVDASNDDLLATTMTVTTSGGTRRLSLKQLLREVWQRVAKIS